MDAWTAIIAVISGTFRCHGLKRGALTTRTDQRDHSALLKRLGRRRGFDVPGEHLEFGDPFLFEYHPLGGVLAPARYGSCGGGSSRCSAALTAASFFGKSPVTISQICAGST